MVKPFKTPIYQPMNQASKVNAQYNNYLQALDKECGTQLSVRSYKDVIKAKKER